MEMDQTRPWCQRDDRVHHDTSSLSGVASGIPSSAATFLRNSHRLGGGSLEDIPECFCPPLEVGKNSLAVALLVIGGARIGIFHAVTQRVVKEYGDLAGCGRDGFRLADTGRQAPEERS